MAREDKLAPKPVNLTFEEAAVVPVSAGTALQAVAHVGRLRPGQTVLVVGASGGVASYAVQLEGGSFSGGLNRQLRGLAWSPFLRRRLTNFLARQRAADLERLTELIEAGSVRPMIDRTYPLDQVPEAMRRLVAGQAAGKIAIAVAPADPGQRM